MKKRMVILGIAAMSFSLMACSDSGEKKEVETATETVETTAEESETEVVEEQEVVEEPEAVEEEPTGNVLAVGDVAECEEHSFKVEGIEFSGDLSEKRGNVTYNHSSEYALAIKLDFQNLSTEAFEHWNSKRVEDVSMEYQGKYNYEGEYWVPVDDIVPLANDTMYIVYEVPESMGEDKTGSIRVSFTIDKVDYEIVVQEGDGSVSAEEGDKGASKVSGEIAIGDVVSNDDTFSFEITDLYYTEKPSYKTGNITYSYGNEGYYLVCQLDFQNLDTETMESWGNERIEDMKLTFADKYDYEGESWIPTNEIVPLGNGYVFLVFEVAESVETSTDPLMMTFTVDGNEFTVNCR